MNPVEPEVSILVLGYNSARYLQPCLASIQGAVGHRAYEILFLNNGSDNSEDVVLQTCPDARILPSQGNIGFASGVNALANAAQGRRLLCLNPDTLLYPESIEILCSAADNSGDYGALGGLNLDPAGRPLSITASGLPTLGSIFLRFLGIRGELQDVPETERNEIEDVETLCGGFFLIDRDLWNEVGGFDESFFLYCEELDLFKRLRDGGYRAGLVRSSKISHDVGSGAPFSENRMFYQTVANAHYIHKHFGNIEKPTSLFLIWASAVTRYFYAAMLAPKGGRYPAMKAAFSKPAFEPRSWINGFESPGSDPRHFANSSAD